MKITTNKILLIFGVAFALGAIIYFWNLYLRPAALDQYGLPPKPISFEYISARSEAKLEYPNGKVFSRFGSGDQWADGAWGGADVGAVMTTDDPPEKVYAWYHDWLLAHGWKEDKGAIAGPGGSQSSLESYSKDGSGFKAREVFYVAMDIPSLLSGAVGKQVPAGKTVFEYRYFIK